MFHSRVRPSALAAASVRPSGLNATENAMVPGESGTVASGRGRAGSVTDHSRTVPSSPQVASSRPSGLKAANSTTPVRGRRERAG